MLNTLKKCRQFFELRPTLKEQLNQQLLKSNNQVFLLTGEEGLGKKSLAHFLASAFLLSCSSLDELADCIEQTDSVKDFSLLLENAHPDLVWLSKKEGESSLKIDELRRKVEKELSMAPQISKKKVWVIDLDDISEQAQNTLLKSLEEAPSYAFFILLSSVASKVLPTIFSRSQEIALPRLNQEALVQILETEAKEKFLNLSSDHKKLLFSFSQGSPLLALRFLEDEEVFDLRTDLLEQLLSVGKSPLYLWLDKTYQICSPWNKEQELLYQIFSAFLFDVMLAKTISSLEIYQTQCKNLDVSRQSFSFGQTLNLEIKQIYSLQEKLSQVFQSLKEKANFEISMHYLLMFLYSFLSKKKA